MKLSGEKLVNGQSLVTSKLSQQHLEAALKLGQIMQNYGLFANQMADTLDRVLKREVANNRDITIQTKQDKSSKSNDLSEQDPEVIERLIAKSQDEAELDEQKKLADDQLTSPDLVLNDGLPTKGKNQTLTNKAKKPSKSLNASDSSELTPNQQLKKNLSRTKNKSLRTRERDARSELIRRMKALDEVKPETDLSKDQLVALSKVRAVTSQLERIK